MTRAHWIEPPKTRIYAVPRSEVILRAAADPTGWQVLDERGQPCKAGGKIYRVVRPDGRVFKLASWVPMDVMEGAFDRGDEPMLFLEEI